MEKTVFERIIEGELQSWKVFEDDLCVAILDITPVNKGHVLVIPKERYSNIYDIPKNLFTHLMGTVHTLAPAVKEATGADGINIIMNNEPAAGQLITNHAHIHIVPRFLTDGFASWHGTIPYTEGEKEVFAEKIKSSIGP